MQSTDFIPLQLSFLIQFPIIFILLVHFEEVSYFRHVIKKQTENIKKDMLKVESKQENSLINNK